MPVESSSGGSQLCHCQLWAPYIPTLLLFTMPPLPLFFPAHRPGDQMIKWSSGHSSHRTHPTRFHLYHCCQTSGTWPKPQAPLVVCINVKTFQGWYFVATTSWSILRGPVSGCYLKFWHSITLLITGEPGFIPFPLLSWFMALLRCPSSSCARSLLRHEESWRFLQVIDLCDNEINVVSGENKKPLAVLNVVLNDWWVMVHVSCTP